MKILNNTMIRRALLGGAGLFFLLLAVMDRAPWMLPVGVYFLLMGVMGWGCGSSGCSPSSKIEKNT
ncbi:hypothetical protein [Planobacterium oryzisoli]|uniref:Uncharacterized protein n=1 Tax=Planobacterium oryzisoli TaxID=2771435 RepID=A0A931E726_9FLAO|nr:hypothetical protein [Planobacterium oryzisoli]MBF5027950.1 hypothetical protein [Planobacterium oryzisoli]